MSNLLHVGKTGLDASKKSLETTGHNIANVNTEGYSRQKVNQTTGIPISKGGLVQGRGARVVDISRVQDRFLEAKLTRTTSSFEYFKAKSGQLSQVENIFNEIDGEGLNHVLNNFYNSFRELANQPENETIRSVVRENANLVVKDIRRIRETLDEQSRAIDGRIEAEVTDINLMLKQIGSLNNQIARLEVVSSESGDLRDQRDNLVRKLSESFRLSTYSDEKGRYVVHAEGVGTMVAGANPIELKVKGQIKEDSANNMGGSKEIYISGRGDFPISSNFRGGKIGGLYQVRNDSIKNLRDKIDQVAYELANTVNAIHRRGYVNRRIEIPEGGTAPAFDSRGRTTNVNFFEEPVQLEDASLNIKISDEVLEDASNIATGLEPNAPGDNRVAMAISKLQHERVMDNGTATLEEFYLQSIGKIGLESGKSKMDTQQAEGILAQTRNVRERISGVSLDEEAANMVKFQHAYEASAKIMQTADEMFQTVLGIKR